MVSGIYSAEFASNQNVMGRGVVILTECTLHGGDEAYYYKGKFKREGNNNISAAVDVGNHSGNPTSIFGPLNLVSTHAQRRVKQSRIYSFGPSRGKAHVNDNDQAEES
jgi:hypothetical protein